MVKETMFTFFTRSRSLYSIIPHCSALLSKNWVSTLRRKIRKKDVMISSPQRHDTMTIQEKIMYVKNTQMTLLNQMCDHIT